MEEEVLYNIISPSSHSEGFPVTSPSFAEWEKCRAHDRQVQASLETGAWSSTTSFTTHDTIM